MEHKSNKSSRKRWEGGKQILTKRFKRFEKRWYRTNKIQHNCNGNIQNKTKSIENINVKKNYNTKKSCPIENGSIFTWEN